MSRYNVLEDHDDIFVIPEMLTSDRPVFIGITSLGRDWNYEDAERFAYTVAVGPYEADIRYQDDELWGPLIGSTSPEEMVTALMGFLSAYGDGDVNSVNGESELRHESELIAVGESAEFLVANSERFGIASSDLKEEFLAWGPLTYHHLLPGTQVRTAEWTGKDPEE